MFLSKYLSTAASAAGPVYFITFARSWGDVDRRLKHRQHYTSWHYLQENGNTHRLLLNGTTGMPVERLA